MKYMSEDVKKQFKDKRILLYGTGNVAKAVIDELSDSCIVGCLDRIKIRGDVCGIPIISWDSISSETADVMIIAALREHVYAIYERIRFRCRHIGIRLYDRYGAPLEPLIAYADRAAIDNTEYYEKNENQLKRMIDSHDCISFDVFDTLIMRRLWQPIDLFEVVEWRLKNKGIDIHGYAKLRVEAERCARKKNIYEIYKCLQNMAGLDETLCETVLKEELDTENDYIVPRKKMVEILNYAVRKGKTVTLISDMYLNAMQIKSILDKNGIKGYKRIYVSCDYDDVGKYRGLFGIYKNEVKGDRYLHIGDNVRDDYEAAKNIGFDAFIIRRASDMIRMTRFRELLVYEGYKWFRFYMGYAISELFNNPFVLHKTNGFMKINSVEAFSALFLAPIIIVYFQKMKGILIQEKYDGILFGSRDGFFFEKAYCSLAKRYRDWGEIAIQTPFIYFPISRKLAFKASIRTKKDLQVFLTYLSDMRVTDKSKILYDMFGEKNSVDSIEDIFEKAKATRNSYKKCLSGLGIKRNKRYVFCEFMAVGNQHDAFNRFMRKKYPGIYLYKKPFLNRLKNLQVFSIVKNGEWPQADRIYMLLECILSSPEPSVNDIDNEGNLIFSKETRDMKDINMMISIQNTLLDILNKYPVNEAEMDIEFAKDILFRWTEVQYGGDIGRISELTHVDDMSREECNVEYHYRRIVVRD